MAAFRAGESPESVWKKLQTLSGKLQRLAAQGAEDKELQAYLGKVWGRKREKKREEKKREEKRREEKKREEGTKDEKKKKKRKKEKKKGQAWQSESVSRKKAFSHLR